MLPLLLLEPVEAQVVPTAARPFEASSVSSLNALLGACFPAHSMCVEGSARISYMSSGDAVDVADAWNVTIGERSSGFSIFAAMTASFISLGVLKVGGHGSLNHGGFSSFLSEGAGARAGSGAG